MHEFKQSFLLTCDIDQLESVEVGTEFGRTCDVDVWFPQFLND